jgi:hypothetical protein
MPTMLILRGIRNLLDEPPAVEYARRRGYEGKVLDVSGEARPRSPQVVKALQVFRSDPDVEAFYGFSGGGYNLRHILASLAPQEKARIKLVVVLGSPKNPASLYKGSSWELVYRRDPPAGHMMGPKALLAELDNPPSGSNRDA